MNTEITIVTAFFDIGRGNWSIENGYAENFERSTEQYFEYFKNLAILKNKIIIFTSENFKNKIKEIRGDLPIEIVCLDLEKDFKKYLDIISNIMESDFFKETVKHEHLKNPECWSAPYVLINNLKSYFVCQAIHKGFIHTESAAWIDFGYFRSRERMRGIELWTYPFELNKVNVFTIKKKCPLRSKSPTWSELMNSKVYFIGGCTVASTEKWLILHDLIKNTQQEFINNGLIDDDQNILLKSFLKRRDLFKVNFLGKNEWFSLFEKYGEKKPNSKYQWFFRMLGKSNN